MEGGSVDEPLDVTVEGPGLEQFQVEVGRTGKIGSAPVRPDGRIRHLLRCGVLKGQGTCPIP